MNILNERLPSGSTLRVSLDRASLHIEQFLKEEEMNIAEVIAEQFSKIDIPAMVEEEIKKRLLGTIAGEINSALIPSIRCALSEAKLSDQVQEAATKVITRQMMNSLTSGRFKRDEA